MSRTDRPIVRLLPAVALVLALPATAANVRFGPSLEFRAGIDGNPDRTGEEDVDGERLGSLRLSLPWAAATPVSTWSLRYDMTGEVYDESTDLNNVAHNLAAGYSRQQSQTTSLNFGLGYSRSARQDFDYRPEDALDPTQPSPEGETFVPRTTIESFRANFGSGTEIGARSSLNFGVAVGANRYDDTDAITFQDSDSVSGTAGWAFGYAEQASIGVSLGASRYTYEDDPAVTGPANADTTSYSLSFNGSRIVGRDGNFSYSVGAQHSEQEDLSDTGFIFSARYGRSLGDAGALSFGASQGASTGDGLRGASEDLNAYVGWNYRRPRGIGVGIAASYTQRNPLLGDAETSNRAFTISDSVNWAIGRYFRVGIYHSWHDQDAPDGAEQFATSYHSGGLALIWVIRGERGGA